MASPPVLSFRSGRRKLQISFCDQVLEKIDRLESYLNLAFPLLPPPPPPPDQSVAFQPSLEEDDGCPFALCFDALITPSENFAQKATSVDSVIGPVNTLCPAESVSQLAYRSISKQLELANELISKQNDTISLLCNAYKNELRDSSVKSACAREENSENLKNFVGTWEVQPLQNVVKQETVTNTQKSVGHVVQNQQAEEKSSAVYEQCAVDEQCDDTVRSCCSKYMRSCMLEVREKLESDFCEKLKTAQVALKETIDEKDKEIQELRLQLSHQPDLQDTLNGQQKCMKTYRFKRSAPKNTMNPEFEFIESLRPHVPTEWHEMFKKSIPVTARCVHCVQSLDPDASAWVCKSCRGVMHAYSDWGCKAGHKCEDKCSQGFYLENHAVVRA